MHARFRGSKSLLFLYQNINKTWFPSLADEVAEPHPDMNIKVAAFTVSEKSSNISVELLLTSIKYIVHATRVQPFDFYPISKSSTPKKTLSAYALWITYIII